MSNFHIAIHTFILEGALCCKKNNMDQEIFSKS